MRLSVTGMACLGSFGSGIDTLVSAPPLVPSREDGRAPDADTAPLKDRLPARALRQMDRFSRMALLCLLQALDDAGLSPETDLADTGIILATGYGPATPTFAYLDSILAHGEAMASPLSFSHSVHNIPAATLALTLGLAGPCATICQLAGSVAAALATTQLWLDEGRVTRVLLGAVDEHTPTLATTTARLVAERARPAPREGIRHTLPVSEGAAFFCLDAAPAAKYGHAGDIAMRRGTAADFASFVTGKTQAGAPVFLSGALPLSLLALPGTRHAATAYGNLPVAQALDLVLALKGLEPEGGEACCCAFGVHGEISSITVSRDGAS